MALKNIKEMLEVSQILGDNNIFRGLLCPQIVKVDARHLEEARKLLICFDIIVEAE